MAKTKEERDLEIAEYGKNELLNQALDRAVLRGALRVDAVKDALDLYGSKCLVDAESCTVTLDGLPLDEAVSKIIDKRPLWKPTGPDASQVARTELEIAVKAGSVTAHGRAHKEWGAERYNAFCAANAAKPGKVAGAADDKSKDDNVDPTNPFVGLRDASGKVDPIRQALITAKIKSDGIAAVSALARAAGVTLGGHPLRKAG
jgi:hypothetical protein